MRRLVVLVVALAFGCGGSENPLTDAGGGGDDGGGDPDGGGGNPRTVKLTLANRPMNAGMFSFLVAYQDGSGPWTVAPNPSGDTYSFPVTAPSYGVAFTCITNIPGTTTTQLRSVTTAHFAVGERTELTLDVPARCSDRTGMPVTLSGTVTNRPTSGVLVVQYGTRTAFVGSQSGGFSLQIPPGTHDLIVAHAVPEGNGEFYVDRAVVIRNVAVTASTTRTIDFSSALSTRYWTVTASVPNLSARIVATTTLYTANGTQLGLVRESSNWETDALAESQALATDVYDQSIAVTTPGQSATITNATSTPGPQTYVAPAPLGAVATTAPTKTPYVTLESTWPAYPSTIGYTWNATQQLSSAQCAGNLACTVSWTAVVSPGVSGMTPGYRMPDLAALPGWKSAFELVAGSPIVGGVTAATSSAGASDFPTGIPANGTKRAFVRSDYSLMP